MAETKAQGPKFGKGKNIDPNHQAVWLPEISRPRFELGHPTQGCEAIPLPPGLLSERCREVSTMSWVYPTQDVSQHQDAKKHV